MKSIKYLLLSFLLSFQLPLIVLRFYAKFLDHLKIMILDVGCGSSPKGNYNIDIHGFRNPEILSQDKEHFIQLRLIRNFIRADGRCLPFRKNTFEYVLCSNVIEHVQGSEKMLDEMIRVANGKVVIACPHKESVDAKTRFHRELIDEAWFNKKLKGRVFEGYTVHIKSIPLIILTSMKVSK